MSTPLHSLNSFFSPFSFARASLHPFLLLLLLLLFPCFFSHQQIFLLTTLLTLPPHPASATPLLRTTADESDDDDHDDGRGGTSHSILSCPLPGQLIVFFPVRLIYPRDLRHQRIIRIWITEQRAN